MRKDSERLQDMREAIDLIERYAVRGKQVFDEDELIQIWIVHYLQIIGEAARSMSEDFINLHPDVPWIDIADFRNVLVHEYWKIEPQIVWSIVQQELPDLKGKVEQILQSLPEDS
ncbi:MAG: DUF86 domain-containing protein [Hormoscilla sp. GUM202]|nr:DUF86 domain-containing protein [Hormoscilla sp. GUM202]